MATSASLDKLFDTVGECLTVDTASKLTSFSLPESLQIQLDDWADRNSLGQLAGEERDQYEAMLRALNFIALLQAKARRIVAASQQ
jgi:hypothetical protein